MAAFILGFTLVYVVLGVSVAFVGGYFSVHMNWLFGIAGAILIIFGLHVLRLFRIPFLEGRFGGADKAKDPRNIVGSFLVGTAFAIGWSPCTGPIIAAILTLAARQKTVLNGGLLLLAYCAGLGAPFLLTGLAVKYFLNIFNQLQRHMRRIEIVSAVLLIAAGVLLLTQNMGLFRGLVGINLGGWESGARDNIAQGLSPVAVGTSVLAGFLSFVSPCVLPLLPSYIALIAGTSDLDAVMGDGGGA